jgi:AAA15 family ATPase/GTPase
MLYRVEIENFYSIRNSQVLDLVVNASVSDESGRLAPIGPGFQEQVPKVIGFFGPNASGKSNVLKALSFLSWFVTSSFNSRPDDFLPFARFQESKALESPCRLAISFTGPSDPGHVEKNDNLSCRYSYEVIIGGQTTAPPSVISESLKYWPRESNRAVNLFQRNEQGILKANKTFGISGYQPILRNVLRPNASTISTLTQFNNPLATYLWHFAKQLQANLLIEKSEVDDNTLSKFYSSQPELLKALNREIERIDFGIRELTVKNNVSVPALFIEHCGLSSALPLMLESHGTRQFFRIFPLLFQALATGGVAVIDELDLAVHPHVLPEIISWFFDSQKNPHDAQLWFSGQNPYLLEELIKEEIFFCQKDNLGRTEIYGLKDIQGVKRSDNFYKKYLSGVYGAVPRFG